MEEVKVNIASAGETDAANQQKEQPEQVSAATAPIESAKPAPRKKKTISPEDAEVAELEKIFGSRTRVKLLRLFFENPYKTFFVREITRVVDEQVNSVRRELANLETLGVIRKSLDDNKIFYGTNRGYKHLRPFTDLFSSRKIAVKEVDESERWRELVSPVVDILNAVVLIERIPGDDGVEMLIVGDDRSKRLNLWAGVVEKRLARPINYMILSKEDYFYRRSVKNEELEALFVASYRPVYGKNIIDKGAVVSNKNTAAPADGPAKQPKGSNV